MFFYLLRQATVLMSLLLMLKISRNLLELRQLTLLRDFRTMVHYHDLLGNLLDV